MMWSERDTANALNRAARQPMQALPTTAGENFAAAFDVFEAEDASISRQVMLRDAWGSYLSEVEAQTGMRLDNPAEMRRQSEPWEHRTEDLAKAAVDDRTRWDPAGALWRWWDDAQYRDQTVKTLSRIRAMAATNQDVRVLGEGDVLAMAADEAGRRRKRLAEVQAGADGWGVAAGFAGTMGAALLDPPNLATLAVGAPAGAGVLRVALTEAGIGVATEALNQGDVVDWKADIGVDYGLGDAALNVATAGAGAGVFGGAMAGVGKLWSTWRGAKDSGKVVETAETKAAEALIERGLHLTETNPGPKTAEGEEAHAHLIDAASRQINGERDALTKALREVEANPIGDPMDPLVALKADELRDVIVARGGFKGVNELHVTKRGWGLVKIVWGHGSRSREPLERQILENDVLALPDIVRLEPVPPEAMRAAALNPGQAHGQGRTWIVERDGRRVAVGTNMTEAAGGRETVVTMFVLREGDWRMKLPLSKKKTGPSAASPGPASNLVTRDTADRGFPTGEGRPDGPATTSIPPTAPARNAAPDMRPFPPSMRTPKGGKPETLLAYLHRLGGVRDEGGELSAMDLGKVRPGTFRRADSPGGLDLDEAGLRAWETGFFPDRVERITPDDLVQAIRAELAGQPRIRLDDGAKAEAWRAVEARREEASRYGIEARGKTDEELDAELDTARGHEAWREAAGTMDAAISDREARAIAAIAREDGRDLDDVAMEWADARARLLDHPALRPTPAALADDIPFEDFAVEGAALGKLADDVDARWREARVIAEDGRPVPWQVAEDANGAAVYDYRDPAEIFELIDEDFGAVRTLDTCVLGGAA